jgi:uncharacterized protein YhhL (DUF1145 family)
LGTSSFVCRIVSSKEGFLVFFSIWFYLLSNQVEPSHPVDNPSIILLGDGFILLIHYTDLKIISLREETPIIGSR